MLAQSVLAQGWLTESGAGVARMLLAAGADALPRLVRAGGDGRQTVPFRALCGRVAALTAGWKPKRPAARQRRRPRRLAAIADRAGITLEALAMRFAAHADGVSSALVQCRTRRQLRGVLAAKAYVPLDAETRASVVALQTDPHTGAHGAERLAVWTWGAPAPRACARWAINRRLHPTTGNALAASHAEGSSAGRVARALADDGFAVLPGAFDDDALREALVAAVACHDRQGYFRSRETGTPAAADAGKALRAAVSAAVDANVETSIGGGSALAALSLPGSKGFEAWVTTHAPNGGTQPAGGWRAPSPRDPRETTPPGFAATWHVDWGNGSRGRAGISRLRTTRASAE